MNDTPRRLLGAFLRERRRALPAPRTEDRPRRGPGLGRDEVAARVFISTEYYTRIEQGRFLPSAPVLRAIADVLELTPDQRQYALDLARAEQPLPARTRMSDVSDPHHLDAGLHRLLLGLDAVPALVIGSFTRLLAWNDAAQELFIDFSQVTERERTCVDLVFSNPAFQSRFVDLPTIQDVIVATLRASMTGWGSWQDADDARHVAELEQDVPGFATRWRAHGVRQPRDSTITELDHPRTGRQLTERVVLRNVGEPEVRVLFFVPMP